MGPPCNNTLYNNLFIYNTLFPLPMLFLIHGCMPGPADPGCDIPTIHDPVEILCDNESAVVLAQEPRSQKRTRHILRKYHYVRQVVKDRDIVISRIDTSDNLADPFTKPLPQAKHDAHRFPIGIRDVEDLV